MHPAMRDYLRGQGRDCEQWEVDALLALTWRDDVPYTVETIAEARGALATVRRSVPEQKSSTR
jgi:hypothetical protein